MAEAVGQFYVAGLYAGSTLVGTATTPPYQATWSAASANVYSVTARATDNMGATTTSTPVTVTITGGNLQIHVSSCQ